jgi:hypothetical protein
MIPAGVVPDQILSAFHRRFPDCHRMWAGSLRLWRVGLAVRHPSLIAEWVARAANPQGLGIPAAIISSIRKVEVVRQSFAFLDLPAGPFGIPNPSRRFDPWPEPALTVPPQVLHPDGVDVVSLNGDWRTVPIVRAEIVPVVAVQVGDAIEVYAAEVEGPALATVPAETFPTANPDVWASLWQTYVAERGGANAAHGGAVFEFGVLRVAGLDSALGDIWLRSGEGPIQEAVLVALAAPSPISQA